MLFLFAMVRGKRKLHVHYLPYVWKETGMPIEGKGKGQVLAIAPLI